MQAPTDCPTLLKCGSQLAAANASNAGSSGSELVRTSTASLLSVAGQLMACGLMWLNLIQNVSRQAATHTHDVAATWDEIWECANMVCGWM